MTADEGSRTSPTGRAGGDPRSARAGSSAEERIAAQLCPHREGGS